MKEVRFEQEILRWGTVVVLLYPAVLTVECPCTLLLKCEDHYAKFTGALGLALLLVMVDNLSGPQPDK